MNKLMLFAFLFFVFISVSVYAENSDTIEKIIIVSGETKVPINFFNDGEASLYTAVLTKSSSVVSLMDSSVYINKGEFGSFNLVIGKDNLENGVYFDSLIVSNDKGIVREIPIIIGIKSKVLDYDVSVEFDSFSDISSSDEGTVSPNLKVYKLNYNTPPTDSVVLGFEVYSLDGKLLDSSEEVISVSRQAEFERSFNTNSEYPSEVLIVAYVKSGKSYGLDVYQTSLSSRDIVNPPAKLTDYSYYIYLGVFIFLLSLVILVSYLWYNRYNNQAKDWKSRLNYIQKTQFTDVARGLRKLQIQKDAVERAYSNHFISRKSFNSAIAEISRLSKELKKRL
ncbi:hypothetical protein J4423_03805 [Candidatus Pacearchaeota archaeon]|nr:hypothetical protein [Candidatus Pacearchaeota archaeon]